MQWKNYTRLWRKQGYVSIITAENVYNTGFQGCWEQCKLSVFGFGILWWLWLLDSFICFSALQQHQYPTSKYVTVDAVKNNASSLRENAIEPVQQWYLGLVERFLQLVLLFARLCSGLAASTNEFTLTSLIASSVPFFLKEIHIKFAFSITTKKVWQKLKIEK